MPIETPLALRRILDRVENRLIVGCPEHGPGLLRAIGKILPGAEVLDMEDVLAITDVVRRVRQQVGVVADFKPPHTHELLSLSELVYVEDYFFRRIDAPFFPRVNRILLPLLGPRVIEVVAFAIR